MLQCSNYQAKPEIGVELLASLDHISEDSLIPTGRLHERGVTTKTRRCAISLHKRHCSCTNKKPSAMAGSISIDALRFKLSRNGHPTSTNARKPVPSEAWNTSLGCTNLLCGSYSSVASLKRGDHSAFNRRSCCLQAIADMGKRLRCRVTLLNHIHAGVELLDAQGGRFFHVYWLRVSRSRIVGLPMVKANFLVLRMTRPVMRSFVRKWWR